MADPGEAKISDPRTCTDCGAKLSRYNASAICAPCTERGVDAPDAALASGERLEDSSGGRADEVLDVAVRSLGLQPASGHDGAPRGGGAAGDGSSGADATRVNWHATVAAAFW